MGNLNLPQLNNSLNELEERFRVAKLSKKPIKAANIQIAHKMQIEEAAVLFNKGLLSNPETIMTLNPIRLEIFHTKLHQLNPASFAPVHLKSTEPPKLKLVRKYKDEIDEFFGESIFEMYADTQCIYTSLDVSECKCALHKKSIVENLKEKLRNFVPCKS